jgi:RHS repeat-associated protein
MTVPMGFSGTNNARRYKYIYDSTGRQIGMDLLPSTAASNATLSANVGSSNQTRFYYNDSENRIKLINKAGDVYYFVYDPTASIPAVVYEAVNNGEAVATYLNMREPDGSLISRDKYDDTSLIQSRTYHFDGLGSTLSLTDEDGDVTDTYTYNAWGDVTNHTGSTTDNPYRYVGQLGYYSHYQEPTFDLLQLGVRFYDPEIGRFTQRDPEGYGTNWFIYTDNRPTVFADPTGLKPTFCQGTRFTKAMCRAGCAAAFRVGSRGYKACLQVCDMLRGNTCEALWALCEHLARHGKKQAAESCYACYNASPECSGH